MNIEISEDKAADNIFAAFVKGLRNYFNFKGRTCRYDYWGFMFVSGLISFCLSLLEEVNPAMSLVSLVYALLVLIPSIFIFVRRMHDINRSFFKWVLLPEIVILLLLAAGYLCFKLFHIRDALFAFMIFGVVFFVWMLIAFVIWPCIKGNSESNKYGEPVVESKSHDRRARWMIFFMVVLLIVAFVMGREKVSSQNQLPNDIRAQQVQVQDVQNMNNKEVENVPNLPEQKAEAEESSNQEQVLEPVQVQSENASEEVAEVKDTHSETEE